MGIVKAKHRQLQIGASEENQTEWKEPFFFIQLADPQFGFMSVVKNLDPRDWKEEMVLAEESVQWINKLKPRFAIVCGDLIHSFPTDDPEIRQAQLDDYKKIYNKVDPSIPLVCVCGNHDVGNTPNRQGIELYSKEFGDDYFSFSLSGVKFLVLNSQIYSDPSQCLDLFDEQNSWLENQLIEANKQGYKHIIIFQHIPWFITAPNDADQYFTIPLTRRIPMLQLFRKYNVRACFCGHYHQNAYGQDIYDIEDPETKEKKVVNGMEMITTSAVGVQLGSDKSGLRIVRIYQDSLTHTYYPFSEVPSQVTL